MGKSQLLQEVKEDLESKRFDVKLNDEYHGIDVSVRADSRLSDKKLFMYVLDEDIALPVHIINLRNIREGNGKYLSRPNCDYLVYAPRGAVENAKYVSENAGIPIFTDEKLFKEELEKYSSV